MSESDAASQHSSAQVGLVAFVKEIYRIWITERPAQFAAALAYYSLFSFVPVIYVAYVVADLLLRRLSTAELLYAEVISLFGEEVAQALQDAVIALAERTAGGTTLASLIGFVALVFAASLVFFQLQHALNTIWQVPPPSRDETRAYVKNRLLALVMVLGVGLLVTVGVYVVQLYLSATKLNSALDAAGSAAVFLMGFFFFGQILVFGAVFTRVYAAMFGSKILPGRGQGQRTDQ